MKQGSRYSEHSSSAVYQTLVQSLFSDSKILVLGIATTMLAVFLCVYATGEPVFYGFIALFAVIGAYRIILNSNFKQADAAGLISLNGYAKWEMKFTISAVIHVFCFGLWCWFSNQIGSEFARFASTTVTLANMIGICGRSFPIKRLVDWQVFAITVPLVLGLWSAGGIYAIMGALMLPFLIGLRQVASVQRRNLLGNIFQRRKAETVAAQFDSALNNVPIGICMVDIDGKLEVANRHIGRFIGRSAKSIDGMTIYQLISVLEREKVISETDADNVRLWMFSEKSEAFFQVMEMGQSPVRYIKFKASKTKNDGVICTFEDITDEINKETQIDQMKRFDRLTGLMNRSQLPVYLQSQLDEAGDLEKCAVILLNLDKFKEINDTLGHRFGDDLLCEVSSRISSLAGGFGACCRFGGDEFAVVLRSEDSQDLAQHLADQLIELLKKPYQIGEREVELGCTVGIAIEEDHGVEADALLKNADVALLFAKKVERGGWCVFKPEMSRELSEKRRLEGELREALATKSLNVFYQPLVSVNHRNVAACEALVRWNHPLFGNIPPSTFIPMAEDIGVIYELGEQVLRQACLDCANWNNDVRVAVNLSAIQFIEGDIVETVRQALEDSKLEPHRLELEITESLMIERANETISKLNALKRLGVKISLDDFGTGYSSLSYLHSLPLDKVKIDRSFVTNLQEGTKSLDLLQAISTLGKQLGLLVVVEGVEEPSELEVLLHHATVDEIQGYLFSKPLPNDDLLPLLDVTSQPGREMVKKMIKPAKVAA